MTDDRREADETGADIRLRYFDGCPSWRVAHARLLRAIDAVGAGGLEPTLERIATDEDAERLGFVGSPTILVNGRDAFPQPHPAIGLTCRVYETPDGFEGAPTVEQIQTVLRQSLNV
ncbi:MAG: DsbA family protein [Actinomycetota bacterium]